MCASTYSHTCTLRRCIKGETHLVARASVALSGPWFHYLSVFAVTRRKVTSDLPQDQFVCKSVRNWRAIEGWHNKSCFWVCEQVCEFSQHSGSHRDTNGAHLSNRTLRSAGQSLWRESCTNHAVTLHFGPAGYRTIYGICHLRLT